MPERKKLKAGVIGLGVMGRHHVRVLSNLPGVDLVGVYDPLGDLTGTIDPDIVGLSIEQVLFRSLDYCVIAVPTTLHEMMALKAIEMRSNVLIEKPIADTVKSALNIKNRLDQSGLVGAVGHIERFNPALIKAKELISCGDLGKVYQIFTRRQGFFPSRIADVGVVKDLGTHDIDLTSWLVDARYEKVTAHTAYYSGKGHEDLVTIIGQLSNGTVATHVIDWLSSYKVRKTTIVGEKGCLIADTINCTLTFYKNGSYVDGEFNGSSAGDVVQYDIEKKEPLLIEHENFRDYVLHLPNSVATVENGIETLRVAEAVFESARTGTTIQLV